MISRPILRAGVISALRLWKPSDLSNLVLWLDASDSSTITIDTGKISQWNDKSPSGRVFTQGTAAQRPVIGTQLNGRDVVDFGAYVASGSGNHLQSDSQINGKTFAQVWGSQNGGSFMFGNFNYSLDYSFHRGLTTYGQASGDTILDATFSDSKLRSGETRKNGTVVDPTAVGLSGTWDIVVISNDGTGTNPVDALARDRSVRSGGKMIAETLITSDVLSTADVQRIEGYFAHKWGQTAGLPGGHPYKTSPPVFF